MNFLVTGASGFVGGNLARFLIERGHTVTALVRRTSKTKDLEGIKGLRLAMGDLCSGEGLEAALEGVDCVHHVAGVTRARTPGEYFQGNGEGTRLLCQAASRQKQPPRFVYCSSLAAAGPSGIGRPKREEDTPAPISVYGRSKLEGELAVRQYAATVPSVIVRPPFIYGPGDVTNLPPLMSMARFGIYIRPGFRPKHFSFIHVQDLCEALYSISTRGKTLVSDDASQGVYFISEPRTYSWEEFCQSLSKALGKSRPRVVPVPQVLSYAVGFTNEIAGRLLDSVPIVSRDKAREMCCDAWTCSSERAASEIPFTPVHDLDAGLRHTVAWYRQEGWI